MLIAASCHLWFSGRYVLQNHSLFLIAEQPPTDMATLLSKFRPTVPPIVKKRAKELLSVITNAVKESLPSSRLEGTGQIQTDMEVNDSDKRGEVVMLHTEIQSLEHENKKEDLSSIWKGLLLSRLPHVIN